MGTRHVIIIKMNNKIVLSQYGQWDGYLEGQGLSIAEFFNKVNIEAFKRKCSKIRKASEEEVQKAWIACGASPNSDSVTFGVAASFSRSFPCLSRDTGAKILDIIYKNKDDELPCLYTKVDKDLRGTWLEYIYTINLDTKSLMIECLYSKTKYVFTLKNALERIKNLIKNEVKK